MISRTFYPALDQRVEYLFYNHPKPWRLSCGEIGGYYIEDGVIYVDFMMFRKDAVNDDRWDHINECVIIEVIDSEDRVVFEASVPVSDNFLKGRIGLR